MRRDQPFQRFPEQIREVVLGLQGIHLSHEARVVLPELTKRHQQQKAQTNCLGIAFQTIPLDGLLHFRLQFRPDLAADWHELHPFLAVAGSSLREMVTLHPSRLAR